MPTLDFKGKQHIYAHHLTVPYRPIEPDESRSCNPLPACRRQSHHPRRQPARSQSLTAPLREPYQMHLH